MPTPSPIMAMISGAKIGVVTTWVSRSRTAKATAIPNRAVMMGRPMATTEPKASSMMMMAARMPMPSLGPGLAPATSPMASPPRATWYPADPKDCAVSMTFWMSAVGRSPAASSKFTRT